MEDDEMAHYRSLNTTGSLQVAERWRDGIRTFEAWFTFQPGRVGHGESRAQAITNIPRKVRRASPPDTAVQS